jgi:hypothetical protein
MADEKWDLVGSNGFRPFIVNQAAVEESPLVFDVLRLHRTESDASNEPEVLLTNLELRSRDVNHSKEKEKNRTDFSESIAI